MAIKLKVPDNFLRNITYENRDLSEVLKEQDESHVETEIELTRQSEERRGHMRKGLPWGRKMAEKRQRNSKVKLLDANQIRLEYGLMKKKFDTHWQNCLWVIAFHAPVSAKQILREVEGSTGGITGALSHIYRFIGKNNKYGEAMITRYTPKGETGSLYRPVEDLSGDGSEREDWFEEAQATYVKHRREYNKDQRLMRRKLRQDATRPEPESELESKSTTNTPKVDSKPEPKIQVKDKQEPEIKEQQSQTDLEEQIEKITEDLVQLITTKTKDLQLDRTANLNININGVINFKFGLIRKT